MKASYTAAQRLAQVHSSSQWQSPRRSEIAPSTAPDIGEPGTAGRLSVSPINDCIQIPRFGFDSFAQKCCLFTPAASAPPPLRAPRPVGAASQTGTAESEEKLEHALHSCHGHKNKYDQIPRFSLDSFWHGTHSLPLERLPLHLRQARTSSEITTTLLTFALAKPEAPYVEDPV